MEVHLRLGVDLTWQVQSPTSIGYSISVFLLNSTGQVVLGIADRRILF